MRFEQYLSEADGRTRAIAREKAVEFIKKNCMNSARAFFTKGTGLFRGHISIYDNFGIINPKTHTRRSANTSNYYTLLVDNLPQWKDYPKRSQSIICANDERTAYGSQSDKYLVLPVDNGKIGVCDEPDFWESFGKTYRTEMNSFNDNLKRILINFADSYADNNWAALKKEIDKADKHSEDIAKHVDRTMGQYSIIGGMIRNDMTLWEFINYVLDPKNNDFTLINNTKDLPTNYSRECWTDAVSVFINVDYLHDHKYSLKKDILGEQ